MKINLVKFLSAFVEEGNSPQKIINLLIFEITPEYIFEIIVANMKKLYLRLNNKKIDFEELILNNEIYIFLLNIFLRVS